MSAYQDAVAALPGLIGHWSMASSAMPNLAGPAGALTAGATPGTFGQAALTPGDSTLLSVGGKTSTGSEIGSRASSATLDAPSGLTLGVLIVPSSLGATIGVLNRTNSYYLALGRAKVIFGSGAGHPALNTADNLVVPGNPLFVVGTWDGTTKRVYLNGVEVASVAASGAIATGASPLRVGSQDFGAAIVNGYAGALAGPFIASQAASLSAIQNLTQLLMASAAEVAGKAAQVYGWSRQVIAANASRKSVVFQNDGDAIIRLGVNTAAVRGAGPKLAPRGGQLRLATTARVEAIVDASPFLVAGKSLSFYEE